MNETTVGAQVGLTPAHASIEGPDANFVVARLLGHAGCVHALVVLADGDTLVFASEDGTLRRWSLSAGAELEPLVGHRGPVNALALAPNGIRQTARR